MTETDHERVHLLNRLRELQTGQANIQIEENRIIKRLCELEDKEVLNEIS